MAIAHFAVGAGITTLILALLRPGTRFPRTWLFLGGIWGIAPDVHWVVIGYKDVFKSVHDSQLTNVFYFHYLLDVYDPGNSRVFAAVAIGFFGIAVVGTEVLGLWSSRGESEQRGWVTNRES